MTDWLVRWTIGPTTHMGYKSLVLSIKNFAKLYPQARLAICYNGTGISLPKTKFLQIVHQQSSSANGVAWKLYPPRLNPDGYELFIDNDLILEKKLDEIDQFLSGDVPLLLEGSGRNYGRFEQHVPQPYKINSGLFGLPPFFNLEKYINFYGKYWHSHFDEQGLVALALTSKNPIIIPNTIVTNCEFQLKRSQGMHFIGLNRRQHHKPFLDYYTKWF